MQARASIMEGSGIPPSGKPKIRPGIDLTEVGLSLVEGRLAALLDGKTSVEHLPSISGLTYDEVVVILDRLTRSGVVVWDEVIIVERPGPELVNEDDPDYGDFPFPPAIFAEQNDLSEGDRKRIYWFHQHLDKWTLYELLHVDRQADNRGVKRGFAERVKKWHPDRWRHARELGSFKALLSTIFNRILEAQQILLDAGKRKAYDKTIVHTGGGREIAARLADERKEERDAKREEERIRRRKERNPMYERIEKARVRFEEAKQCEEAGNLLQALTKAQLAEAYDQRDEYTALVADLKVRTAEQKVEPILRRGSHYENLTDWPEAIEWFEQAVRLAPEHGPARVRLANTLVRGNHSPEVALVHAQKAVQKLDKEPEAYFVLALCYAGCGKSDAAVRALKKALELKPNYKEAKKLLRRLQWGF